jgi:hypothetical protein
MKAFALAAGMLLFTNPLLAEAFRLFPQGHKPNGFVFFMIVVTGIFVALAVHELGHLFMGLAQGFRFQLFVVGLLGLKRTEKGIHIYLNKNLGMMGGIAATVPVAPSPKNKKKFAWTVLSGPLTSLVFGISCVLVSLHTNYLVTWFLLIAGMSSIGLFFATTLPSKSGIFFTDRARFQRLISKGKAGETEEALLSIIAQTMSDNSHKNLSLAKSQLLQTDDEPFMRFWGYYYEFMYYKENELTEQANAAKTILLANRTLVSKQIWKVLKIDDQAEVYSG